MVDLTITRGLSAVRQFCMSFRITKKKGDKTTLGGVFWLSVFWVLLITFLAFFADILPFQDPLKTNLSNTFGPIFQGGHILGTDPVGRDMFSRLIHGAQVSLTIAYTAYQSFFRCQLWPLCGLLSG